MKPAKIMGNARPAKELRDEVRRDEIVAAARECVVRRGFHAASMAEIAATAGMSVGQIYRYFVNKEAIVHAIVERIVAKRLQTVNQTAGRPGEARKITELLTADVPDDLRDDDILMLEVTAESTRNPAVAEIVRRADERLRAECIAAFDSDSPGLSADSFAARLELMAVLFEGTVLRRMTVRPAQTKVLRDYYLAVIELLLSHDPQKSNSVDSP